MSFKKIQSALISVYYKDGLAPIISKLHEEGVVLYSTGGTQQFIEEMGIPVIPVEDLTGYPSIFGGRVKTLHPKVFGGILYRRDLASDVEVANQFEIPALDLVMVDLYPFEETVASGASDEDIIEKIDIGGISLIRGAAKNFNDVLIVSSRSQYGEVLDIFAAQGASTNLEQRRNFAGKAFAVSSGYDSAIQSYFAGESNNLHKFDHLPSQTLRYGENPHQTATFYGDIDALFTKLNGKELSYNNLVDVDACLALLDEFKETAFVIIKHTNACGVATGSSVKEAYQKALSCDPVSAFGGVLACNGEVDKAAAEEINSLFCEILIAPSYSDEALEILKSKKNRILLQRKPQEFSKNMFKTLLNGVLEQDKDLVMEEVADFKTVTEKAPTEQELKALAFALKICKHTKSNTIVLAKEGQLLASGVGQTSRVDALKQAIEKAAEFGFDLNGSVMASDAFFPFPDCVEIAGKAGITAVTQPGGSIKDKDSVDYCNQNGIAMVMTGIRHFKH
ncbi:bifunctional phosphoribosylaminoimidazolecarboxamide formyltransferase/IMP cyclohydrolase [Sandaracinomonas limnophila]|uniref:Bifunctional purine biosynthesis protein PurH n=1 Tax=Sandaracinomonas limnophila TaxID=1862386 RepID=A0A437PR79_9BACT|nr:bifunctional phosphoribosylaminoimidazolecarboxamide formyltransferase/IMP cyclohydrolase [Sandaracinomonas limnophila]RVU24741.1 bifunctional phosphoribosylaminoimidazolecarboxamide formyltransferase/IMP cyclohydrolase [Sandaracinomonas limnophila]